MALSTKTYPVAILIIFAVSLMSPSWSNALESQLSQTIEPITCVYTNVTQGSGHSLSTTCQSEIAPTITSLAARSGHPLVSGTYSSARARTLSVYVGAKKYTLTINNELTVNGDNWTLDTPIGVSQLRPGIYDVVVEVLTIDDILLRSVYDGALIVPINHIVETRTETGLGATVARVTNNPTMGTYRISSDATDRLAVAGVDSLIYHEVPPLWATTHDRQEASATQHVVVSVVVGAAILIIGFVVLRLKA